MSPNFLYQQGQQEDQYLQQQAPTQPPPQQQPPQQDFNASDNIRFMQLQAAQAQVEKQLADRDIYPHEADMLKEQFMPQLTQLQQKREATQARQAAKASQAAMQQAAQQQGIANVHMQTAMQTLPSLAAHVVDPVTGRTKSYIPQADGKGGFKVEPVEWDEQPEMEEGGDSPFLGGIGLRRPGSPGTGPRYEPPEQQMEQGWANSSILGGPNANNAPGSTPEQLPPPVPIEQFAAQQKAGVDPASFEQTIQSGPYTEKYRGGQLVSTDRPAKNAGGEDVNHVPIEVGKEFYKRANAMVPPLGPNASPHEQLARQGQVDAFARQQTEHYLFLKRHEATAKQAREEHILLKKLDTESALEQHKEKLKLDTAEWLKKQGMMQELGKGKSSRGEITHEDLSKLTKQKNDELNKERADARKRIETTGNGEPGSAFTVAKANGENTTGLEKLPPHLLSINHKNTVKDMLKEHFDTMDWLKGGLSAGENKDNAGGKAGGGKDNPPPPAGVDPEAAKALEDHLDKRNKQVMPQRLTEEEKAEPMNIPHEKIAEALRVADKMYMDAPHRFTAFETVTGGPFNAVRNMGDILRKAKKEGRSLTKEEARQYAHYHSLLPESDVTGLLDLNKK